MSNPEKNTHFEDLAALHALGLLDEAGRAELLAAARRDPAIDRLLIESDETAARLALESPEAKPPPRLRQEILDKLPAAKSNIISFNQWLPYAIAACLMIVAISQSRQIGDLKSQLSSQSKSINQLTASNAFIGLKLQALEAKDPNYTSSRIMVAWDPNEHRGAVALQNLPTPPVGHDYQLWVLDPAAQAPVSAGVVVASRSFAVQPVSDRSPGFAVSLEPTGGSPEPTGPILFAVAPGA